MHITELARPDGHERLLLGVDTAAGYRGIIAIHSTALGPAVGGARFWSYRSDDEAITDALRLARGMTYKNAMAGLPLGGGKSVIIGDNRRADRETLFSVHGRFVQSLGGEYVTAEDVGTSPADMEIVRRETPYVAGLVDRSGDPSPVTAHGVFRAIQASAYWRWGSSDLRGKTVAVQGVGHVGYYLCRELAAVGAKLIVSDIDAERVSRVSRELGATAVEPEAIYAVPADIFAPCALGGVLNDATIPRLKVEIVAGAANNQLLDERHGDQLAARGILFAPDYVANAGGVINGSRELLHYDEPSVRERVERIYDTMLDVYERAKVKGVSTNRAADEMAEERMRDAVEIRDSRFEIRDSTPNEVRIRTPASRISNLESRFVDLSHTLVHGMTTYPGLPGPVICDFMSRAQSRAKYAPGTEFHIGKIEMVANTGTYVDAPFHRFEQGKDLAELPLESLADLEAIVVRARNAGRAIGAERFAKLDVRGKAVLVDTGWSERWGTDGYLSGHPFLTRQAAELLVEGGAALVGIDSLNIDDTDDSHRPVHTALLGADIPVAEHLTGLERLPDRGARFFAVPVKVKAFGTFPVRAFAIVASASR
ncbi:MAG TPA: Glu/Leu/Phe/Val dehydrogenase dimerization domain-containing protein [Gemmatimonadaceae bacterium]|nr:Glu/Leu/Phe/Val dehydrogenase dimerization domain-containing protein [Gemmatimonadaceae bacterium]